MTRNFITAFISNIFQSDLEVYKKTQAENTVNLRQRNSDRAKAAIVAMGNRYLCHPSNQVKNLSKTKPFPKM